MCPALDLDQTSERKLACECFGLPLVLDQGLAIATIADGRVQTVYTFGKRNAKGDPFTPDTIMYGASLTKAVFAYYAAQVASEGRLDLDQPIASLLPKPLPEYGNLDAYGNWGDLAGKSDFRITSRRAIACVPLRAP